MSINITNSGHAGYRRGGVAFVQGTNQFPIDQFSKVQLAQIHDDPRLLVQTDERSSTTSQTSGGTTAQGSVDTHSISELVELIQSLDPENVALWKKDGTPKADIFPKGVTADQRDAAWQGAIAAQESTGDNSDTKEG